MEYSDLGKMNPDEILDAIEENTDSFRWTRDVAFSIGRRKYTEVGNVDKAKNLEWEALLFAHWDIEHPPTRGVSEVDYKEVFSHEMIEYYRSRSQETRNPIMKARYCVAIWETKKEISFLKQAIASYFDACEIYFQNDWGVELFKLLKQSFAIFIHN